jgi:hypothetical protein
MAASSLLFKGVLFPPNLKNFSCTHCENSSVENEASFDSNSCSGAKLKNSYSICFAAPTLVGCHYFQLRLRKTFMFYVNFCVRFRLRHVEEYIRETAAGSKPGQGLQEQLTQLQVSGEPQEQEPQEPLKLQENTAAGAETITPERYPLYVVDTLSDSFRELVDSAE